MKNVQAIMMICQKNGPKGAGHFSIYMYLIKKL